MPDPRIDFRLQLARIPTQMPHNQTVRAGLFSDQVFEVLFLRGDVDSFSRFRFGVLAERMNCDHGSRQRAAKMNGAQGVGWRRWRFTPRGQARKRAEKQEQAERQRHEHAQTSGIVYS